jgi:hypothetical protein
MTTPDPHVSPTQGAAEARWLHDFVREALHEEAVDEFVRRVNGGILEQVPPVAEDPLLVEDLMAGTRAHWRAFLGFLTEAEYRHELPVQAGHLARSLARRGLDLGVLLKVYRVAHQQVFAYVTEVTEEPMAGSPGRHEALVYVWRRAGAWIDDSIEELIEIFYGERRRLDQGALARRSALIEALLADRSGSAETGPPTRELGHALRHWQTGFVLWSGSAPEGQQVGGDPLAEAAAAVARALGAPPPLTHLAGSRDLWGWCATPVAADLGALDDLRDDLAEQDLRLAVGVPARGVVGFRTSHGEARAAQALAAGAVMAPRVIDYRDVELLCLCAGNEDRLRRMVLREIGPLCVADKNVALVRQTVLAFLAHQNVEAAAQQLFVHKNTVRYRLARAEELLGRPIAEHAAQVELALRHVELFGPPPVSG